MLEIIDQFELGEASATVVRRFDTIIEVSWFINTYDAGVFATNNSVDARDFFTNRVNKIKKLEA